MAEFTVSGERNGRRVSITWRDGALSGTDQPTVDWIEHLAAQLDGSIQGLPGLPGTLTDHLSSPYTAYALIRSVFPGKTRLDRPLPRVDIPDGAIS